MDWLEGQNVASDVFAATYGPYLEATLEEAQAFGPHWRPRITWDTATAMAAHEGNAH